MTGLEIIACEKNGDEYQVREAKGSAYGIDKYQTLLIYLFIKVRSPCLFVHIFCSYTF